MLKKPLLFILLIVLLAGCRPAANLVEEKPLQQITFMAGYQPQANLPFVGVYVAQEKGYFAEENLEVTIEHSPGQGQHLQLLASGKIQVTTQDAAVLLRRRDDPGLPLVSIALLGQKGQQAFAALASSGIQTPLDWEGRTVGYKGTPPPDLYALLKIVGADVDKVNLVNVGYDPRLLTEGNVDVYPLFKSNEPYLIKSWGYDLTLWDTADYGVPGLGLTYVTSDEILQQDPRMLARFLRAALKGIEYAKENVDEAVQIVLEYTGPEADPEHMRFMLETELQDLEDETTEQFGIGWQAEEKWQDLADMLVEYDLLRNTSVVDGVYTNEILEMIAED